MENSCPATPLILTDSDPKTPLRIGTSSPESDEIKSPSRDSPDSHCVICLGKLKNKSFTDSCLHQFCFQCLLQWSKVKAECPLCKQPFKSIIHNVRSNLDYDQYHVEAGEPRCVLSDFVHTFNFDFMPMDRRFRYRSTMTSDYFRELAESLLARNNLINNNCYQNPSLVTLDLTSAQNIRSSNRLHANLQRRGTTEFRRNIYNRDLWVQDLRDITGRYRECSPQFYRENPAQIHRIVPWLNREVNVLLNNCQSQAAYILTRIISYLSLHSIRSREFKELVEPHFGSRTDHFIHELYMFAHSVYDIAGFDQNAVYGPNPNYATEVQEISSSSSSADDSDVEIVETIRSKGRSTKRKFKSGHRSGAKRVKRQETSHEPVAGPSGLNASGALKTLEISGSDQDDVEILDFVKPEPELIVLSSDEDSPGLTGARDRRTDGVEVVSEGNGETFQVRISSSDEGDPSVETDNKSRYRCGKGKCKSNGHGLKGKQKQKYIKSRKSGNTYSSRNRSGSGSGSSSSSSSSDSNDSYSSSDSGRHRSRRRKSGSWSREKHKKSGKRGKSSHNKPSAEKRRKSDKISRGASEETHPESRRKVKSCVIIPGSHFRDFPPSSKHEFATPVGAQEEERTFTRNPHYHYPTPYWSMTSAAPERESRRRCEPGSAEERLGRRSANSSACLSAFSSSSDES